MNIETPIIHLTIPLIAALIGWVTNYIAVKMIFRPRRPIKCLGVTLLGLIPRRQRELARTIGQTIERELVSHEDVQRVLSSKGVHQEVFAILEQHIDKFLKGKLGQNPMLGMFLQGEMGESIKKMLLDHLSTVLPEVLQSLVERVESELSFSELVTNKIEQFDLAKLESIIYAISAKELKAIEILGGVLGFLIGLIQVGIVVLGNMY
ncbi:MAG: DUF445 family protein [Deltaproteobacteria bacterium]|nr:DUF445 family protein [Deltaproteobacteria bacterium]